MDALSVCFHYWGKADPEYPGEQKWHPFVYHSLDVAAVTSAFWVCSPAIRHAFKTAYATKSDNALRAWILFFVALHDIGKIHALFQIKAPDALTVSWPEIDLGKIRRQPYDHGCDGYAQADLEISDWIGTTRRSNVNAFGDWLAAVAGHHGSICAPDEANVKRGYAAAGMNRRLALAKQRCTGVPRTRGDEPSATIPSSLF